MSEFYYPTDYPDSSASTNPNINQPVEPSSELQSLPRPPKAIAQGLTVLAILSTFTFVAPSQQNNRWLWEFLRWGGLGCGVISVAFHARDRKLAEAEQYTVEKQIETAIAATRTRLEQYYQNQLYQQQLHHQDEKQAIAQQYLGEAQIQTSLLTTRYQQQLAQSQNLVTQLQQQVEGLNLELTQAQALAIEQINQERDAIAIKELDLQRQLEALEADHAALANEHQQLDQWLSEQKQALMERTQALDEREAKMEGALMQEYQAAFASLQQREQELNERQMAFDLELQQQVDAIELQNTEWKTQMQAAFDQLWNERVEYYEGLIGKQLTEAFKLKQPEHTAGATHEELLADKVIDYLYKHGIIVKRPVVETKPPKKFTLTFTVLPVEPVANDFKQKGEIEFVGNLVDAAKLIQNRLLDGIKSVVKGCESTPTVETVYRGLRLTIDISGVNWEAQAQERDRKAKEPQIIEADPNWLLLVAEKGNHFRITGPTDSGKSVLADNLVGALRQIFGDLGVTLADPKYPFTEWTTFDPNYKGAEECLVGCHKLERLVESRFLLARKDKDAGREIREFPAELFALDEAEILMDEARLKDDQNPPARGQLTQQKNLVRMLRKGLKLGRGLTKKRGKGLKVMYVMQSPLCSRVGLNRDDFDQSVNIFIGENIPRALTEELKGKISTSDRDFWEEQYHLRVERGDQYFCLVKMPGKRPFMATMPLPGTYAVTGLYTKALSDPEPVTGSVSEEELEEWMKNESTLETDDEPTQTFFHQEFEEGLGGDFNLSLPYLKDLLPHLMPKIEEDELSQGSNPNSNEGLKEVGGEVDPQSGGLGEDQREDQRSQPLDLKSSEGFGKVDGEVEPNLEDENLAQTSSQSSEASASEGLEEVWEEDQENSKTKDRGEAAQLDPKIADCKTPQPYRAEAPNGLPPVLDETAYRILPWTKMANAIELFNAAKPRIIEFVQYGYTKPLDICIAIWGQDVNPKAKPYNGKLGMKVLIEKLIQELHP